MAIVLPPLIEKFAVSYSYDLFRNNMTVNNLTLKDEAIIYLSPFAGYNLIRYAVYILLIAWVFITTKNLSNKKYD